MLDIKDTGKGKVVLLGGGGKIYTDLAARFVRTEKPLIELIESPYSPQIVQNIISSGHGAALEFDYFLFGVEGYSRVTETQLVRKRLASYLIKSGRAELGGKRKFSVVIPESIKDVSVTRYFEIPGTKDDFGQSDAIGVNFTYLEILELLESWYEKGIEQGTPEEDLRYMKPQGTEFKAIIGMNAHALRDWFQIRCCRNAQHEIRDLAMKMLKLSKSAAPDLFEGAGASCVVHGYCPENRLQNEFCKGKVYTKDEMRDILKNHRKIR